LASSTPCFTFFLHRDRHPRDLHSFPTRRSSDLVQYRPTAGASAVWLASLAGTPPAYLQVGRVGSTFTAYSSNDGLTWTPIPGSTDRKSTRLNSSHVKISYAVYCLKKNNDTIEAV